MKKPLIITDQPRFAYTYFHLELSKLEILSITELYQTFKFNYLRTIDNLRGIKNIEAIIYVLDPQLRKEVEQQIRISRI